MTSATRSPLTRFYLEFGDSISSHPLLFLVRRLNLPSPASIFSTATQSPLIRFYLDSYERGASWQRMDRDRRTESKDQKKGGESAHSISLSQPLIQERAQEVSPRETLSPKGGLPCRPQQNRPQKIAPCPLLCMDMPVPSSPCALVYTYTYTYF